MPRTTPRNDDVREPVSDRTANLVIRVADYPADFPEIQAIRTAVFQVEQRVDAALEFDGQDAKAQHILALWQGQAVGTARWRQLDSARIKVERVAVLKEFRGLGIGKAIMVYMLDYLEDALSHGSSPSWPVAPGRCVQIHAQTSVQDFYEQLGFMAMGDRFQEAGIPHIKMQRSLRST
jgi:predicted GNAT family N-acyltransferase